MDIHIQTIEADEQRYPTVGDYWREPTGDIQVRVTDLGDDYMSLAVAIHELVEAYLCLRRGIKWEDIDKFDKQFEEARRQWPHDDEPGDSPGAPYRREHRFAENIERQLIQEAGIPWDDYDKIVADHA